MTATNSSGQAIFAALALLVLSGPCAAADIPVSYNVDAKAFKGAVSGTSLTFALFSDTLCSVSSGSVIVPVDDVLAESIKTIHPKGSEPGPKVARLHHVLSGVTAAPQLYLTVTGTGITAVGGNCQAQGTGAQGADGPSAFFGRMNSVNPTGGGSEFYSYPVGAADATSSFGPSVLMLTPSFPTVITKITAHLTGTPLHTVGVGFKILDSTGALQSVFTCTVASGDNNCSTSTTSGTVPASGFLSGFALVVSGETLTNFDALFEWEMEAAP